LNIDQSNNPPIPASSSSSFGGGGGAFLSFLSYFLGSTALVYLATGAVVPADDPTDPTKSVGDLVLRVLAKALTRLAPTATPDALRTAFKDSTVTLAPDPDKTKAA
jgi:hypothetical protein